jgi:glycolate dehydrogenase FAD-binding subunit
MNPQHDQLARQLESVLSIQPVTDEPGLLGSYVVDGKNPVLFCSPESPEQVSAVLRICSAAEAAVTPWGGGTALALGNLPRKVEVIIGLNRLNRVIEHDEANLTATVEAGISLANLQDIVARQKQFLPFDAPFPAQATVGGTIAANLNGPRRSSYSAVRDLVIGMKVALASGEQIKAGGKVVKNVAGYDMCKLFVGSLGTLGIITEATLRMSPVPQTAATLVATGTPLSVTDLASELARSQLTPTAVFVLNSQTNKTADAAQSDWHLAVWSEGFEENVHRHLRDVQAIAERIGLKLDWLRDESHQQYWNEIRDFALRSERLIYRVTVPRAAVTEVMKAIADWKTADFDPAIVSDAAVGTIWIAAAANRASVEQFPKLITLARERDGHAVTFAGPPSCKQGVDVWGSLPPGFSLMREIKRQFDPKGILNPGRFLGGI